MKKVAFYTLGCKLNFSETSSIGQLFTAQGFKTVTLTQHPHIFVINTCSVTEHTNQKCTKIVKKASKISPKPLIVVIGCYAQLKPHEIATIPGVDLVLGTHEKFKLLDFIQNMGKKQDNALATIQVSPIKHANTFSPAYSINNRTRTFLKIQDGCNYHCTFCTIPLARGHSRSTTIQDVVKQVKAIAQNNIKEIVLTGVNIGDFGIVNNQRQATFFELIQILSQIKEIERFRISSIEPNLLNPQIVDFIAQQKNFMPHFHIPLQSGSDKILKLMHRRYSTTLYQERIQYIKHIMPSCCIGVDVIVGFPGETEQDFLETYHFLNTLPISYLHVFPYSEREYTKAAKMADVIAPKERAKRAKMLRILSEKKLRYFYQENLGKPATVLFEYDTDYKTLKGFTENYIRVQYPYQTHLANTLCKVLLQEINEQGFVIPKLIP